MAWPANGTENWNDAMKAHVEVSLATDGKVKDGAVFSTSAAPTVDAGVANKKYVDDNADPTYSGGESHTFNGGLIIKSGYTATTTVAFEVAFPTGIISVNATKQGTVSGNYQTKVGNVTTSGFGCYSNAGNGYYWFAIGY